MKRKCWFSRFENIIFTHNSNGLCYMMKYIIIDAAPQDGVVDSSRSLLYNYNQHSK